MTGGKALAPPSLAPLAAAFAVIALALLLAGFLYYRTQERQQRDDARKALTAVSVLKVDQISRWRGELMGDAAVWSEDPNLAGQVLRYLSAPTPAGQVALRSALQPWKNNKAYADAAVADARGNVLFSLSGQTGPLPQAEAAAFREALSLHRPVLTDLHREPGDSPHVSAVAPLFISAGGTASPAGAVILQCDATTTLYPLVVSWPTDSRSGETLLVRRDGDAMLFLNDLRHQAHTAFELRIPLTRRDVPSVMAGAGRTGFVEGVDHRGVPVLADIRVVPGIPWFAVTKIDLEEAMAPWHASVLQLGCLLAGLLAAVSAFFLAIWETRAKTQYKLLLEASTARSATAAKLAAIVEGSQDAIIATTVEGVVTSWNEGAERLSGYSAAEMIGQPIGRLAPPGSGAEDDEILQHIRRGERVEHRETIRLTKDGRLVDVSLSVSRIKDASGSIVGSSRVLRDITAEKRVRRDLDRLRWMLSAATPADSPEQPAQASVHQLAGPNTARLILDAAGDPLLAEIAAGFEVLMGTCFTVHEANGDLAYSLLALRLVPVPGCQFHPVLRLDRRLRTRGSRVCLRALPLRRSHPRRRRVGGNHEHGIWRPHPRPFPTGATGWEARRGGRGAGAARRRLRNAPPLHRRAGQAAPGRFRPPAARNRAAPPRRSAPPRNHRQPGAQQPRTRGVRLRSLPRPAGAAPHGGQFHPTAG